METTFCLEELAQAARAGLVAWARAAEDADPSALVPWDLADEGSRDACRAMARAVFDHVEKGLAPAAREVVLQEADALLLRLADELVSHELREGPDSDFARALTRLALAASARRRVRRRLLGRPRPWEG